MSPTLKTHGRRHRGVFICEPDETRRIGWRIRYRDPDSRKTRKETIPALAARTRETREDFAARRAKALEKRKLELAEGATRATGTPLVDAVERYYRAHPRLRDKTLAGYRGATDKLLRWAAKAGVHTTDQLTRAKLLGLREQLITEPKRSAAKGGKRGARVALENVPRSAFSVNREIAALRTVLGYLAELDLLSKIREGDLRRALKKLPVAVERIEYLKSTEIRQLLEAALRYDETTFIETRAEHRGDGQRGSTTRYEPVAPLAAALVLSGMRLGEAIALDWSQVDLDALDNEGKPVGEIQLTATTKTKRARTIDLGVSPALRDLLLALRGEAERKTGHVFEHTHDGAEKAAKRLRAEHGAPESFTWQALRRTCGTFLTNAPGIFGAASAYRSARQLGHSVAVAEKHYLGLVRGIPATARTLEAAMGIEAELERVITAAKGRAKTE